MSGRRALVLVALAFAACTVPAAEGRLQPRVRTLAAADGIVLWFHQDGNRLAWIERPRKSCKQAKLGVRAVRGGRKTTIPLQICDPPGFFAFGGDRAIWRSVVYGNNAYYSVGTVTLRDRRPRTVKETTYAADRTGTAITDVAADGAIAVYGETSWIERCANDLCDTFIRGGGVMRVAEQLSNITGTPPVAELAVGGGRIAIAPPAIAGCVCNEGPTWSPDGGSIAYSTRRIGPDWEIAIFHAGTGRATAQTDNWVDDRDPDWRPDGRQIAYVSGRNVVVSDRAGTRPRAIAVGTAPAWSPDGRRLAFTALRYDSRGNATADGIWIVNADGSGGRRITPQGDYFGAAWSPNGSQLASWRARHDYGGDVVVVDASGESMRTIAEGASPDWALNGSTIAYHQWDGNDYEVRAIEADGTADRALTSSAIDEYWPDWSPDGTRLAYVRETRGRGEVYTMSASGTDERRVTVTQVATRGFPAEIRTLAGELISRFRPRLLRRSRLHQQDPAPSAYGLALSRDVVVAFPRNVNPGSRHARLELFTVKSGRRLRTVPVPATFDELSVSGRTVVFHTERTIWALDATTGKRTLVAVAKGKPIGLSIEGRRIAWAENVGRAGRIRAVQLGG